MEQTAALVEHLTDEADVHVPEDHDEAELAKDRKQILNTTRSVRTRGHTNNAWALRMHSDNLVIAPTNLLASDLDLRHSTFLTRLIRALVSVTIARACTRGVLVKDEKQVATARISVMA